MAKKIQLAFFIILGVLILNPLASFAGGGGKGGGDDDPGPKYYSYEDLRSGINNQKFMFANINKPPEALVSLGYDPGCGLANSSAMKLTLMMSSKQYTFGLNKKIEMADWDDSVEINFDWGKFSSTYGPGNVTLVFLRGNGMGADIVKAFSEWTHVAVVDSYYSKKVFESTPNTGVNINYAPDTWKDITYYTCKISKLSRNPSGPITTNQLALALHNAEIKYTGTPYFPKVETVCDLMGAFVLKWCDKDDQSSMYCSKLVYNTFKGLIDFNTKLTSVDSTVIGDAGRPFGAGFFGWFGVAPDDIYFSNALDYDFCYSDNLWLLHK